MHKKYKVTIFSIPNAILSKSRVWKHRVDQDGKESDTGMHTVSMSIQFLHKNHHDKNLE